MLTKQNQICSKLAKMARKLVRNNFYIFGTHPPPPLHTSGDYKKLSNEKIKVVSNRKMAKLASQRNIQKISREEEAYKAKTNHEDLMETHKKNISDVCRKVKKISGDQMRSTDISEVKTFLGSYTCENVLEVFRANTEYLCNENDD